MTTRAPRAVGGIKQPDVIWASAERLSDMRETGDPSTLTPEICVEVMSDSNDWDEIHQKRELYLEAGAEEVWGVGQDGQVWFFTTEEMQNSGLAPGFPDTI